MVSRPAKKRKFLASGTDAIAMAGASSKSGLFRLQVDELLAEIQPNQEKSRAELEGTLRTLKELIERIPARAPLPVSLLPGPAVPTCLLTLLGDRWLRPRGVFERAVRSRCHSQNPVQEMKQSICLSTGNPVASMSLEVLHLAQEQDPKHRSSSTWLLRSPRYGMVAHSSLSPR
jgi:hypothetical protein